MTTFNDHEMVKRYSQWCGATHGHGMNEHEQGTYVLWADYDALLTREAALREQLVAQARAAEQWRRHAQLVEKSENHTRAELAAARERMPKHIKLAIAADGDDVCEQIDKLALHYEAAEARVQELEQHCKELYARTPAGLHDEQ